MVAALTEPMAVALHAVRRGEVRKRDVAIVIGCGPVGLGVILMLKASGVRTVVASDYSPGRRALAGRCEADLVVDPSQESPYGPQGDPGWLTSFPARPSSSSTPARNLVASSDRLVAPWRLAEGSALVRSGP